MSEPLDLKAVEARLGWWRQEQDETLYYAVSNVLGDCRDLLAALREHRAALRALHDKVGAMEEAISAKIVMETIHGRPWTGPTWGAEMNEAATVLASVSDGEERDP
jgi:hypothetical protein